MKNPRSLFTTAPFSLALISAGLLLAGANAQATDTVLTLNSGSTDLTSSASYNPVHVPAVNYDLLFSSGNSYAGNTTLTANTGFSAASINDASATALTITNNSASANDTITLLAATNNIATTGAGAAGDIIYVASGGSLSFLASGTSGKTLSLAITGSGNIDDAGTLSIASGMTITSGKAVTFTGAGSTTVSGNIAETGASGAVTVSGAGTVTLSGTNSYTGATTLNAGATLVLAGDNTATTGALTFTGGTLDINSSTALGSGTITLGTTTVLNNTSGHAVTSQTDSPTIVLGAIGSFNFGTSSGSSSNNLNLGGATLSTTNSNKHATINGADQLTIGTLANSKSLGSTLYFDNGTGTTSATAFNFGGLSLSPDTNNDTFTIAGSANVNITGAAVNGGGSTASGLTYGGTGTLSLSGTNTYAGTTTLNGAGGTLVLSGSNSSAGATTVTNGTLQLANTASDGGLASGTLSLGGGTLQATVAVPTITNAVILTGTSTISGAQSINLSGGVSETASATLNSSITGSNSLTISSGAVNIDAVTGTALVLTIAGSGNTTISSAIQDYSGGVGTAHGALNITNTGTTTLSGTNTYGGKTTVGAGSTVEFANESSLYNDNTASWTSSSITVKSGGTLVLAVGASSPQFTTSDIAALLSMSSSGSTGFINGSSIGFDTTAGSISYGPIANSYSTGALGVTKLGANTLTLTGTNSYTGPTQVNGGVLSVTGSTNASSVVTVGGSVAANTPTLNGTGTINGNVIVASAGGGAAGNISPGTSGNPTGTLTIGGTISFQVGSTFTDTLSGANAGELIIGGTATVAGGANISIVGTPVAGDVYTLASAAGGGFSGTNGGFSLTGTPLPTGWQITVTNGGSNLILSQSVTGTTYTVVTTPAPTLVVHQNGTTTLTTTITNTGTGSADTLDYSGLGATSSLGNGLSPSGTSGTNLANNSAGSASNVQTYTATNTGTDTITNTGTSGTNHSGSVPAATGTFTGTTVVVYSGQGTWTGGSGSWGTPVASPVNWTSPGGVPGLAGGSFKTTDSATFGNTSSQISVTLDGQSPYLNTVTFNNTTVGSGYTIAKGTGGTLHLDGAGSPATAYITNTAGNNTISAPVELDSAVATSVARSTDTLTISGAISEAGGSQSFAKSGAGTLILSSSSGSIYSGGTTISGGKVYVNNTSGSGTGSGSVSVSNSGTVIAGKGSIGGAVTLGAGTTLYSGGVASGSPVVSANTATSTTGLTLSSSLGVNSANLTFALGADTTAGSGSFNFAQPSYNSTYMKVGGVITFTGSDSISLVDLTDTNGSNGALSLRINTPYLLIANSLGNAGYSGLVTETGSGANAVYSLDQNGFVVGVAGAGWTPAQGATNVTAIQFNQFGADGVTPLAVAPGGYYPNPILYLSNGDLEVVPEPGTWALMIGGLALLVFIQRRKGIN